VVTGGKATRAITCALMFGVLSWVATPGPSARATDNCVVNCLYPVRGMYSRQFDEGYDEQVAHGINYIDTNGTNSPVTVVGELHVLGAQGLKASLWLGGMNKADEDPPCDFTFPATALTDLIAGPFGIIQDQLNGGRANSAVGMYYVADEPDGVVKSGCGLASTVRKIRERVMLILDLYTGMGMTRPPTFLTIYSSDPTDEGPCNGTDDCIPFFANVTDVMGLDRYACKATDPLHAICDDSVITAQAGQAEADGVREYWGVVGAFFDGYYGLPSAAQLHDEFCAWRKTNMTGYLVYKWREDPTVSRPDGIGIGQDPNHDLLPQLALENSADYGPCP
jgi:hypothetical protein